MKTLFNSYVAMLDHLGVFEESKKQQILDLLAQGMKPKEVASELDTNVSYVYTVKNSGEDLMPQQSQPTPEPTPEPPTEAPEGRVPTWGDKGNHTTAVETVKDEIINQSQYEAAGKSLQQWIGTIDIYSILPSQAEQLSQRQLEVAKGEWVKIALNQLTDDGDFEYTDGVYIPIDFQSPNEPTPDSQLPNVDQIEDDSWSDLPDDDWGDDWSDF